MESVKLTIMQEAFLRANPALVKKSEEQVASAAVQAPQHGAKQAPQRQPKHAAKQQTPARARVPRAKPVHARPKSNMVTLKDGGNFVLFFDIPRKLVPKGLQVTPQSGGGAGAKAEQDTTKDLRFSDVDIDLDGLMTRCSVDRIHVCKIREDFCRVYVNCVVGVGGEQVGFNHWAGQYEQFIRRELMGILPRVIVRYRAEKTSLEVRRPPIERAETRVVFAIER